MGNKKITQFLRVTVKEYNAAGVCSLKEFLPYAIWHNQKTGLMTLHTNTGYYKVPVESIEAIELLQGSLFD